MALTIQQKAQVAAYWANLAFSQSVVANFNTDDIAAAATAIDNAFDATLNQAVAAVGGTTTVIQGLASVIPAPFNTATAQQKTLLACYVLMKREGLI
jgi:hypothetical protein